MAFFIQYMCSSGKRKSLVVVRFYCWRPDSILIPLAVSVSQPPNRFSEHHQHLSPGPNLASDPKSSMVETQENHNVALHGIAPEYLQGIYCLKT